MRWCGGLDCGGGEGVEQRAALCRAEGAGCEGGAMQEFGRRAFALRASGGRFGEEQVGIRFVSECIKPNSKAKVGETA